MKFKQMFIKLVDTLGIISFSVIIVVCMAQIINRYFFSKSFVWAEELAVELMIWITFLGAAKGTAQQSHTRLAVVVNKLPPTLQCIVSVLANVLCMVFAGVCVYYGTRLTKNCWSSVTIGTKVSLGLIYMAVPFCSALMIIFLIINSVETIKDYRKEKGGVTQ